MWPPGLEANDLAVGMDSPVRAACADDAYRLSSERLQGSLKLSLDSPLACLYLETEKVCAIILDRGPQPQRLVPAWIGPRIHGPGQAGEAYSTSSRRAILAASPWRMPSLNMRV
jgi:hypothetical protein